jgi:C-terminal processing protease CtpA/Prc
LAEGDVVVEVDGRRTAQMDVGDVANAIRGEQGSRVTLMVRRGGAGAPERVVLERARVTMPVEQRRRRGPPPHAMPPP